MNVLKPHLQSTVFTLLERNKSQRQIQRLTGIDRKTIRRYQAMFESEKSASANSPMVTTGSETAVTQTPPPPRPPATDGSSKTTTFNFARSASEPHREWIEQQVRLVDGAGDPLKSGGARLTAALQTRMRATR